MFSTGHVDWLAVTFPAGVSPHSTMPLTKQGLTWVKSGRPANGYRTRLTNDYGAAILCDGPETQGVHLILSGDTLAVTRSSGVTDRELCNHVLANDGKLTRLDVAIDIFEGKLTASDMAQAYSDNRLTTPAKGGKRIAGIHAATDDSLCIGSRSSDRYFRAYNKARELGFDDMSWLRLELELKKVRANAVALAITNEHNTRSVINRVIGDYVQMPDSDELNEVLKDQSGPMPSEGRKLHNTLRWLLEQVAPAAARFQAEHKDEDVFQLFLAAYTLELNKLIGARDAIGDNEANIGIEDREA